jgi:DNA-binding IclR family transcriptional regulator
MKMALYALGMAANTITPAKPAPKRKHYSAPALEKGLDILELLAAAPDNASLSEIAGRLKRSVGEIFRMLAVLEQRQYVAAAPGSDRYQLTMKLFQLSHMHLPINALVKAAVEPMRQLSQRIGQSCHLVVLDDAHIRIIARQESFEDLSFAVRVGMEGPVFQTCSGNVLYAHSDEPAREALVERVRHVGGAVPALTALTKLAAKIRRAGCYEVASSMSIGITDIGYPVFGHNGSIAATLAVPFLDRVGADHHAEHACAHRELSIAAANISRALGAPGFGDPV